MGSNSNSKLKLIGYLRVSTARQKDEGYSLETQREAIQRYCQAHSHELISLEEESESAIKTRPVFQRVKERVLNGKADGLIIAKLDRLGRSVRDLANIAEELRRQGKQLISSWG